MGWKGRAGAAGAVGMWAAMLFVVGCIPAPDSALTDELITKTESLEGVPGQLGPMQGELDDLQDRLEVLEAAAGPVHWSEIQGRPAGLDDGDNDSDAATANDLVPRVAALEGHMALKVYELTGNNGTTSCNAWCYQRQEGTCVGAYSTSLGRYVTCDQASSILLGHNDNLLRCYCSRYAD